MPTTFPHPCCQCGFCCLAHTCSIGQQLFKVGKYDACPGLEFEGDMAHCLIAKAHPDLARLMGVGAGCCIKAQAIARDGRQHDFASLPSETKRYLAQRALAEKDVPAVIDA